MVGRYGVDLKTRNKIDKEDIALSPRRSFPEKDKYSYC